MPINSGTIINQLNSLPKALKVISIGIFVDVYTVASGASEVQLALNNHELSASIVKVGAGKVEYKAETSAGAGDGGSFGFENGT